LLVECQDNFSSFGKFTHTRAKLITQLTDKAFDFQIDILRRAQRLMFIVCALCRFYDFEHYAEIAYEDEADDTCQPSPQVQTLAIFETNTVWESLMTSSAL
jgi:hypothetical protein